MRNLGTHGGLIDTPSPAWLPFFLFAAAPSFWAPSSSAICILFHSTVVVTFFLFQFKCCVVFFPRRGEVCSSWQDYGRGIPLLIETGKQTVQTGPLPESLI